MDQLSTIESAIEGKREALKNHEMYDLLQSVNDIRTFSESHVFAVWDFMSLLKALQQRLTCISIPWFPADNPVTARFINEIVLGEETDVDVDGEVKSHFEMYIEAMEEIGADTQPVLAFIEELKSGKSVEESEVLKQQPEFVQRFVRQTFDVIATGKAHVIASAFTFGREDVIPDMFIEILSRAKAEGKNYRKFLYYIERHIEVDGDEHGPLSLQMISELCGQDALKWQEVQTTALEALENRIQLWSGIREHMHSAVVVS